MNQPFVVVANYNWLLEEGSHQKRLKTQDLCPVGGSVGHLSDGCRLLVKNRSSEGAVSIDPEAKLIRMKGEFFIKSRSLSAHLTQMPAGTKEVLFYFEGDQAEARVIVQEAPARPLFGDGGGRSNASPARVRPATAEEFGRFGEPGG